MDRFHILYRAYMTKRNSGELCLYADAIAEIREAMEAMHEYPGAAPAQFIDDYIKRMEEDSK